MAADYVIQNRWALGDTVCLSALVRDLNLAHPGQFRLAMSGHYANVFWVNNPYVSPLDPKANARVLRFDYRPGIRQSSAGVKLHFLTWFHRNFEALTGVRVPVLRPKGDIHLSEKERKPVVPLDRYWVVVAGGKLDMTAKIWSAARFQQLVDRLAGRGVRCVQAGATFSRHVHPTLKNCHRAVGATRSERQFFSLIYNAEGVVCGVTAAMHIAAAFDKPCVVIAGGREEPWWEAYTNDHGAFGPQCPPVRVPHRFLHTLGQLDCCQARGCWKARTVPLGEADLRNADARDKLCKRPVRAGDQPLPLCLDMITVDQVYDAVMSYYEDGTLEPPAPPRATFPPPREAAGGFKPLPLPATPLPAEFSPAPRESHHFRVLDHPTLGGKVTVFVLGWGDHRDLLEKCLTGILDTVPPGRRDLRVALNQPSAASLAFARGFDTGVITKLYVDHGTRRKYQAMREMFWDEDCPIRTKYVVWFDDDTIVLDKLWLPKLAGTIVANHDQGARLYGARMFHDLQVFAKGGHNPRTWFEQADWWRGLPLRLRGREQYAPNGSVIDFAVGWFWALAAEAVRVCDIPDGRLEHNFGDVVIGEQVHQGGYRIKMFNENKKYVWCPKKEQGGRRGFSQAAPFADPATRANHRPGS